MEEGKKKNIKKNVLLAASIAGLMAVAGTTAPAVAHAEDVQCYGVNKCKGTGDCGGKSHSCAGKNSCKGKGWLSLAKDSCLRIQGSSLTPTV